MISFSLSEIQQALQSDLVVLNSGQLSSYQRLNSSEQSKKSEDTTISAQQIKTDSRQLKPGDLFIALMGERFDGHQFISTAMKDDVNFFVVEKKAFSNLSNQLSASQQSDTTSLHGLDNKPQSQQYFFIVEDTKLALGALGRLARQKSSARFVALTGSSGKTSVKEMTAAILSEMGTTIATAGNFNNEIGVPLTLLRLTGTEEYAVIELGANHQGEIAYTASLVMPESVLINNIAPAHLEGFGSFLGVSKAKSEIFTFADSHNSKATDKHIANNNTPINIFLNKSILTTTDEAVNQYWQNLVADKHNKQLFGIADAENHSLAFYATNVAISSTGSSFILHTPIGQCEILLPLLGRHAVENAIAATSLALSVGATLESVKHGLQKIKPVKGRLFPVRLYDTHTIIDDSYNANVGSMKAAIDVLEQQNGYNILVVGDMAELGPYTEECHNEVGIYLKNKKIDAVYSIGNWSHLISDYHSKGHHFQNKADIIKKLQSDLIENMEMTILVKGSRSASMEEIIQVLQEK